MSHKFQNYSSSLVKFEIVSFSSGAIKSSFYSLGEEASKEECPIFVAASHSSFFDAFVIPFLGMPIVLSREENKNIPLFGEQQYLTRS